jgi:hypothetical protein
MTNSLSLRDNVNRINDNNCWLCFIQQNILKGNGACLQGEQNFAKFLQYFMIQCMHDETNMTAHLDHQVKQKLCCVLLHTYTSFIKNLLYHIPT